jgi:hypothetical protein
MMQNVRTFQCFFIQWSILHTILAAPWLLFSMTYIYILVVTALLEEGRLVVQRGSRGF